MANTYVVICTRNRPQQLASLLEDLGQQSEGISKVVVVDSSDSPLSIDSFSGHRLSKIDELTYLHSRAGLPYQRNVALNYLRSRWSALDTVHFLDDDVRVGSEFISTAKSLLSSHPEASVVGVWDRQVTLSKSSLLRRLALIGDSRDRGRVLRSGIALPPVKPLKVQAAEWCPGFSLNFSVTQLSGFWFDGRYRMYGEDVEACLRLNKRGPVMVSPELSLIHVQNEVGRDQARTVAYFSDVFRWRLSEIEPKHVAGVFVVWSTLALLFGELALSLTKNSDSGVQRAFGHVQFLYDLLTNQLHEQLVEHDYLDFEPKFDFTVRKNTEDRETSSQ